MIVFSNNEKTGLAWVVTRETRNQLGGAALIEQQALGTDKLEPSCGWEDGGWLGGRKARPGEGQDAGGEVQNDCQAAGQLKKDRQGEEVWE